MRCLATCPERVVVDRAEPPELELDDAPRERELHDFGQERRRDVRLTQHRSFAGLGHVDDVGHVLVFVPTLEEGHHGEIHEPPRIAAEQTQELKPGMVVTIEPGIYMPGKFGIRIEDMVVVTEKGSKVLTPVSKALIEL